VMILWITILVMAWPLSGNAKEAATEKKSEVKQKAEVKKKQDMSNWWTKNPLTFDPMPEELLWHLESTYQFDRSTGNWTSDNHMLTSQLSLRYNLFTNHIRYTFDKRNVAKPSPPPDSEKDTLLRKSTKHEIHEDFRFALTKRIYLAPGMFYLKDDYAYIDERCTYYAGVGADLITHPLFRLSMFGAYGYETQQYIDEYHETYLMVKEWGAADQIERYDPGTEEADVIYINQAIRLFPYYDVMVTQECIYIVNVSETDLYRLTFRVGVDFKIRENLFVTLEFKDEFDNGANQLLGIRKRDQTQGIGIKVSF